MIPKLLTSAEMSSILIGQRSVNLEIIRSVKRKRTLSLKIKNKENIVIMAPKRASKKSLHEFLNRQMNWLQKKLDEIELLDIGKKAQRNYSSGEMFPFLGETYPLRISVADVKNVGCTLLAGELAVQIIHVDQGIFTPSQLIK